MAGYFKVIASVLLFCINFISSEPDDGEHIQRTLKTEGNSDPTEESLQTVDAALFYPVKSDEEGALRSPMQMFAFLRQTEPETLEISRAAEAQEIALRALKDKAVDRHKRAATSKAAAREELELIANLSGCAVALKPASCSRNCLSRKYRTITGICNNRYNPLWGAASTALARWLPAEYEDEESQPKGWNPGHLYKGFTLPPVREVSNKIMRRSSERVLEDDAHSQMLVDWGQYIDHDISFTPQCTTKSASSGGLDCLTTCENINPCFPIKIPPGDRLSGKRRCLPFFRSSPACIPLNLGTLHRRPQRQQMNAITSFLDASTVYGHTEALQHQIRNLSSPDGHLAVNTEFSDGGLPLLPSVPQRPSQCFQDGADPQGQRVECFLAGDSRASEILPLSTLHTLWVREHNRLASSLKALNPHWSAEHTYQEARKIVGALHQVITMRDYIPKIIGLEAFDKHVGTYTGYNLSTNPTVSNVFATAAFRFGHATIPAMLRRLNESFQEHQTYPSLSLHQTFFSPWRLVKEGGLDPVLRGLLGRPAVALMTDHLMTEELTERLVVLSSPGDLDLSALNLQRGRDHGLPGYNEWRDFCGYERVETPEQLRTVVSNAHLVGRLMEVYGHPGNMDVWLGGLVEDLLPGARTSPIFACLIGKQMKALRDGDRFWWENRGVFTPDQRQEIQRHSLSRVICDNSGVKQVPLDAFRLGRYPQDFLPCDNVPAMNLQAWQEDISKVSPSCSLPASVENGDFVLCSTPDTFMAIYSCHHGYRLEGSDEAVCTESGWSGRPPICKDV